MANELDKLVIEIKDYCASLTISHDRLDEETIRKWFLKYDKLKRKVPAFELISSVDLEPDFIESLNKLINIHIKPTKKRFK